MVINVYKTVISYNSCAKNCTTRKNKRRLQLLLAREPLKFVAVSIWGSQPKKVKKQPVRNDFQKLILEIYTSRAHCKNYTTAVSSIFFDASLITYAIPSHLFKGNSTPFSSKFFRTLCTRLGTKHNTKTTIRVSKRLDIAQKQYKRHYDARVCNTSTFKPGPMI